MPLGVTVTLGRPGLRRRRTGIYEIGSGVDHGKGAARNSKLARGVRTGWGLNRRFTGGRRGAFQPRSYCSSLVGVDAIFALSTCTSLCSPVSRSTGIGKMTVVFFSTPISVRVCR